MADEPGMSHLAESRIRMRALIPIIRAMEKEIGVERAHELVRQALDAERSAEIRTALGGSTPTRMPFNAAALDATFAADDALRYEVLREDEEAFDMNVTGCRYKALMQELGALDLGRLLFCDLDFASAEAFGLELVRTQTCMQGASHCDFRYRVRSRETKGEA